MFTEEALIDTIEYISSLYSDKYYYVHAKTFNFLIDLLKIHRLQIKLDGDSTFFKYKYRYIYLSDILPFNDKVIKIYNDDQYPFYIDILTKNERMIQNIIE